MVYHEEHPIRVRSNGAPGRIRTHDLLVRSQALYPAELRGQHQSHGTMSCMVSDDSKRFKKEKASASSPDFFRQDKETERQKQIKEVEKNEKLTKLKTQVQLDTQRKEVEQGKTGPA